MHTPASAVGARGGDKSGAGVCDKGTASKLDKENSDSNHLLSMRCVEWGEGGKEGGGAAEHPSAEGSSRFSVFLIQTYLTSLCMSLSTHLAEDYISMSVCQVCLYVLDVSLYVSLHSSS